MQVSKWGNSLAVRLPKALVEELKIEEGDELKVVIAKSKMLAVEKVDQRTLFLNAMEEFKWSGASNYKFNRDEANER